MTDRKIELRDYQSELFDKIFEKLDAGVSKLCVELTTGGGKSVIIGLLANTLSGRTIVLTHRAELLKQNGAWIKGVGVLDAKRNTVISTTRVVIASVQTLHSRIKKYGVEYIGHFDNIILDEVHVQIFKKVFKMYNYTKLIGFTATPVTNKKKTFTRDGVEFVRQVTLSEQFDDIVTGPPIRSLIDEGYLVQDFNVVLKVPDFDKLVESASQPDGYTAKSLNDVYNNRASLEVLTNAIEKYCKGKKTLIFNSTTESNKFVFNALKKASYNVKLFDSVNSESNERTEIVEWFRKERESILIGANVFTTGFDVDDIEVVILNRATKSLSLFIQMCGRGSRPTDRIYKDKFTIIDLGQNIFEHGTWSDQRNWRDLFFPQPAKRKRKMDILQVWECANCGAYNVKGNTICEICGFEKDVKERSHKKDKDGELVEIEPAPLPKSKIIIEYTKRLNETTDFAFKLLDERIIELFSSRNISRDDYLRRQKAFVARVEEIYRPIYFAIIRSELRGKNRRLSTQFEKIKTKINKYYDVY